MNADKNFEDVRTGPPDREPNNQDVFIWALYLLGGADKDVDVEEIYLKCFELAPLRLGWRTHPEIPDYKKTSKALQTVEAKSHKGMIHRPHQHARRLTVKGIDWVIKNEKILREVYASNLVPPSKATNTYEHLRVHLKSSRAWASFSIGQITFDLGDLASALRCSPTSPKSIWLGRLTEMRRTGQVLSDKSLIDFADAAENFLETREQKW